ncbi:hypothetical protein D910_09090 [Dendroctonus ponderosae]|uniref:Uncharacterized protein n=1 Tax=Dendroctonus ponderosae TaxID=77166 RepID=U4UCS9_DENPD|nr:hypothetical protein D910_09090 [Dendroctonus ponderosae]
MSIINHRVLLEDHPSYLKWFGTGAVTLIYAKKLSVSSNSEDRNLNSDIDPETSVEECDLTGQPLYVDLGDNSNNAIETLTHQSHDRIWPKDELRHYPLPVREARKTLNKILREGNVGASQPYYVLCAGDDSSKTVLLGANISDFMGCSVQLLKPLPACKVESSLEDMVLAHLRNCFTDNSQNVSVVVGHPLLKLSFIWPQLLKLQRIFSILSDSSNFGNNEGKVYEKMSLCDVPLDTDDILQSITNLVSIKEFCPIRKKDVVDVNFHYSTAQIYNFQQNNCENARTTGIFVSVVNMSEDGYKPFCKSIEQEYIFDKSKITDFKEIISTPLHAVHFNLDINYASFIDSMLPSQWTLTMESGRETTIYHLSPQPIYPPEIISHVPPPDIDGPFFYVTKMNRSYTKLC